MTIESLVNYLSRSVASNALTRDAMNFLGDGASDQFLSFQLHIPRTLLIINVCPFSNWAFSLCFWDKCSIM